MRHERAAVLVIFAACLLRMWNVWTVPFHYDELSAIFRARAESWQDHIRLGVLPDGHPPAVQTFLWIWLKVFEENPAPLHILVAMLGGLSVWFIYRAAQQLTNTQTAANTAILYALSYLPFAWSQQIRPYSFGMAATAALIMLWSQLITGKGQSRTFVGFGLLTALCALTHYFAGLLAALLWITGIVHNRQNIKSWLLTGLLSLLLTAPAWPVIFVQISHGGLDWLGRPDPGFLLRHMFLLFNRQWFLVILIGIALILTLYKAERLKKLKSISLYLFLFLTPALLGYIWSVWQKPVLQDTVLLFSAPFFFLAVAVLFENLPVSAVWIAAGTMMSVGLFESRHFSLGMKDGYKEMAEKIRKKDKSVGMYLTQLADGPQDVLRYHLGPEPFEGNLIFMNTDSTRFTPARFWNQIRPSMERPSSFALALNSGSHPLIVPLAEHWCGYELNRTSWIGAEFLSASDSSAPLQYKSIQPGEKGFDLPLKELGFSPNDVLVIHLPDTALDPETELISVLRNGDRQIDWRSCRVGDFRGASDGTAFLAIKLADIPGAGKKSIWHIKTTLQGRGIQSRAEIRISKGNPYLYGVRWRQ